MTQYDENRIRSVFSEVLGIPESEVTDSLAYSTSEAWDSLKHLQMIASFEDEFGIEIEMDDIIAMETYARVKEILKKYLD